MGNGDHRRASIEVKLKKSGDDKGENKGHQVQKSIGLFKSFRITSSKFSSRETLRLFIESGGGDFLRISSPGSRPFSDFRLASKGGRNKKRQANQGDTFEVEIGSRESEIKDSTDSASRRLWTAVLVQSFKDLCSLSDKISNEVFEWSLTEDFEAVCDSAGVDIDKSRMVFRNLKRLDPEIRNQMMGEIVQSVGGSPGRGERPAPLEKGDGPGG